MEFSLVDSEDQDEPSYQDYDSKPIFHLLVSAGKEGKDIGTMYATDEEWEKLKELGEPLQERIIECYRDSEGRWRYLRFRDDKESANYITTYESVYQSIADAVSEQDLKNIREDIQQAWMKRDEKRKLQKTQMKTRPTPYQQHQQQHQYSNNDGHGLKRLTSENYDDQQYRHMSQSKRQKSNYDNSNGQHSEPPK